MALCIVIDGLWMEREEGPTSPSVLARLAAVGHSGQADFGPAAERPEEGEVYRLFLSGETSAPSEQYLPLGYLAAQGMGLQPDPTKGWAILDLVHLYQKNHKLCIVSPERVGLSVEEKKELVLALEEEFLLHGWTMHWSDLWGQAVISTSGPIATVTTPLPLLEGASLLDHLPKGVDAPPLLSLITTGQMILARASLNQKRAAKQRLPLNSPWIWGIGHGMGEIAPSSSQTGTLWSRHPAVAGLALAHGWPSQPFVERWDEHTWIEAVVHAARKGVAIVHEPRPAQWARLGMLEQRRHFLARLDGPLNLLLSALARGNEQVVVTSLARLNHRGLPQTGPVPWVMARGDALTRKQRFWHRGRLGRGTPLSPKAFQNEWKS